MIKTLYVSDLDGTLLNSDKKISSYTNETINKLVEKGLIFSYATARSYYTSHIVADGLDAKIPLILYNGAMIIDNVTHEILLSNFFNEGEAETIVEDMINSGVYPIIYEFIENKEKFSYIKEKMSKGASDFIKSRLGDERNNSVSDEKTLVDGEKYYITCIDDKEKLEPFYKKYKGKYHAIFQKDLYSGEQWLEIMPKSASKANAIKQLKDYMKCDKVVVFGDGKNDIDMFEIADESYAVSNAVDELKQIATKVIDENNNDAVAKWLLENYEKN